MNEEFLFAIVGINLICCFLYHQRYYPSVIAARHNIFRFVRIPDPDPCLSIHADAFWDTVAMWRRSMVIFYGL